jgi:hypothetical protein
VKKQVELASPSKIRFKSVSLWRRPFQFDALSALYGVADFHGSIAKNLRVADPVASLKLSVAITNLDLQIAVRAADTTMPIGWHL